MIYNEIFLDNNNHIHKQESYNLQPPKDFRDRYRLESGPEGASLTQDFIMCYSASSPLSKLPSSISEKSK